MGLIKFIPFEQTEIISQLDSRKHRTLSSIDRRFGGLCELICNQILVDDLLGKGTNRDSIKNHVTLERINNPILMKSHICNVFSIFIKANAFLFGRYPDNVFSCSEQNKLVDKTSSKNGIQVTVNRMIFEKGLKNLEEEEILKFCIFKKKRFKFLGHSMLIKKMPNDKFIFFDPSRGEYRDLSFSKLFDLIDLRIKNLEGTEIFLTRGQNFLDRLRKKSVCPLDIEYKDMTSSQLSTARFSFNLNFFLCGLRFANAAYCAKLLI